MHAFIASGAGGIDAGRLLSRAAILACALVSGACLQARPRDGGGEVAPAPPPAPAEVALRLPPDLVFNGEAESPGPVIFRHATHVAADGSRCVSCHPQPFRMLRPIRRVSHEDMDAGRSCGLCHDGGGAFGTAGGDCERCHAPEGTRP